MRNNRSYYVAKIVSLSILVVILLSAFLLATFWRPKSSWKLKETDIMPSYGEEFQARDVDSVEINWDLGKVTIGKTSGNAVTVKQTGSQKNGEAILICSLDNSTLSITHPERSFTFFNWTRWVDKDYNLEVNLPNKLYDQLTVTAGLGKVIIDDIESDTFEITADMGEVKLTNLKSDYINVSAAMGSINGKEIETARMDVVANMGSAILKNVQVLQITMDVSMGSGELQSTIAPDYISADVSMGSLDITIPDNDGFTLHTDVSMGKATSDFSSIGSDGSYVYGDGTRNYLVDVGMGSFHLKKSSK